MRCAAPKRARMDRTIYYCITQAENGLKTEQYLRRLRYSAESLKQLKKNPECILVNQTPSRMNRRLKEGDVLTVRIIDPAASGHVTAVPLPFNIVYEDEDILVIHKPAGMPVHPSKTNTDNTLANALAWYYRGSGEDLLLSLCRPAGPRYIRLNPRRQTFCQLRHPFFHGGPPRNPKGLPRHFPGTCEPPGGYHLRAAVAQTGPRHPAHRRF